MNPFEQPADDLRKILDDIELFNVIYNFLAETLGLEMVYAFYGAIAIIVLGAVALILVLIIVSRLCARAWNGY